ncbi:MAG: transketolase C-terminal domain-containing protein [Acidilobaceae archaeon]
MSERLYSMREALGRALADLGEIDGDVVVVTADVGEATRAVRFFERYPERYFNVGISEQHAVSFAAGLAALGMKPVVVAFAMFLMRAWEQIRNTVVRMNLGVKLVGTHAGFSDSTDGSSHQALEDIALMRVLPGMTVVVPADACQVSRSLPKVVESVKGPAYYRVGRDYSPPITCDYSEDFVVGRAEILRDGEDVVVVGAGTVLWNALKAAEELKRVKGLSVAVVNMHTVKPLDEELLLKLARKTGAVVTVEEHSVHGGLGSAIAETLAERYPAPVEIVGTRSLGRSARSPEDLLEHYGLGVRSLVQAIERVVERAKRGRGF